MHLLRDQGLKVDRDHLIRPRTYKKSQIRRIHGPSRAERLLLERAFVQEWLPRLSKYLASGREVDPTRVKPIPIVVDGDTELAALFRLASLWWSVPVSRGFGRRFRVLVFDESNGKLFGLLGLTDPVFNLRARDNWVGWDTAAREDRLCNMMDAYVLGAVPPYNRLLGAKFMALLAGSDFVREVFRKRYRDSQSIILERECDARLAMVTATSALGRSSIYNRLRVDGEEVFQAVGYTEGYGHFHLANGTFELLRKHLDASGVTEGDRYEFGQGPNYRFRVVRKALECLRLPPELLRHGVQRAVYVAPLAENSAAFLRGDHVRLRWFKRPLSDISELWRDRWLLPRAERDVSYREFNRADWSKITQGPSIK
jgi:hypothetical protein